MMYQRVLIDAVQGRLRSGVNGRRRGPCPACEAAGHVDRKLSFVIYPDGFFRCYRCQVYGHTDGVLPTDGVGLPPYVPGPTLDGPPEGYLPIWCEPALSPACFAPARAYLAQRGLGMRVARAAKLGA